MALVTLMAFLPTLLLSVPAGVLADRYDRRLLMMLGDGCSALGIFYILLCMMNEPEILFADEPTGALNKSAAKEVMTELVKLNREGTAILLVTHDSKVASQCDRIMYLSDGCICGELTPGNPENGRQMQREAEINRWLMEMGW